MEESTSLTKCQQSRCVKRLVSAGLIRCAAKGLPARRFFYIVDDPQILEGIIGVCEPSPEENAPAVRSETSPQEVRKSDGWQSGITAAGSAESSQKTKDNKTKENKPENIKPDSAQLEAARSRINHAELSRKYGSGFADLAAEVTAEGMAGTFTLTTDGRTLSAEEISSVFSRIDYSAVSHVADYISGKSGIRNLKAYLRSALYRAVGELSQKPAPAKRDYSEPLWDDDRSAALNEDILGELREMYGAPESSGKDYNEPLW